MNDDEGTTCLWCNEPIEELDDWGEAFCSEACSRWDQWDTGWIGDVCEVQA